MTTAFPSFHHGEFLGPICRANGALVQQDSHPIQDCGQVAVGDGHGGGDQETAAVDSCGRDPFKCCMPYAHSQFMNAYLTHVYACRTQPCDQGYGKSYFEYEKSQRTRSWSTLDGVLAMSGRRSGMIPSGEPSVFDFGAQLLKCTKGRWQQTGGSRSA